MAARKAEAADPNTPPERLAILVRDRYASVSLAAGLNPSVPAGSLLDYVSGKVKHIGVARQVLSTVRISNEVMEAMGNEEDFRYQLMFNPHTSADYVQAFAESNHDPYRMWAARRPDVPLPVVRNLLFDNHSLVRVKAHRHLAEVLDSRPCLMPLTEFCQKTFGMAPPSLTRLASAALKEGESLAWCYTFHRIFRPLYQANPSGYIELIETVRGHIKKGRTSRSLLFLAGWKMEYANPVRSLLSLFNHRQLKKILTTGMHNARWAHDAAAMYMDIPDAVRAEFRRLPSRRINSLRRIHDVVMDLHQRIGPKDTNGLRQESFHPWVKSLAGHRLTSIPATLVLPGSGEDLALWGAQLRNCIGNGHYARRARQGTAILIGVKDDAGEVVSTLELSFEGRLVQAVGFGNAPLEPEVRREIGLLTRRAAKTETSGPEVEADST